MSDAVIVSNGLVVVIEWEGEGLEDGHAGTITCRDADSLKVSLQ